MTICLFLGLSTDALIDYRKLVQAPQVPQVIRKYLRKKNKIKKNTKVKNYFDLFAAPQIYGILYYSLNLKNNFWRQALARTSMKLIGYSILDIGYSMLEKFLSPAFTEHSLSLMR